MYPNAQLGWGEVPLRSEHHSSFLRTPAYRHLALLLVVLSVVIIGGTSEVVKVMAAQQVVYKPPVSKPAVSEPSFLPPAPKPQAPVLATASKLPSALSAVNPPASGHSSQVQAVLNAWSKSYSGKWSVVVQGLGPDQTKATLNPDTSYNTASIYKLFMMYPLFKTYDLSSLSSASVTVSGKGNMNLKTCVQLAIVNSDNPCGEAIGNKVGWGRATTLLRNLGMAQTNLNSADGITTTAADSALFLQKLYSGQLMAADEQQYLMELMEKQVYRSGIPAGCAGCVVADKVGFLSYVTHDVGIVRYSGKSYVLAVMTSGAGYAQIAQLTSQIQAAISTAP